MQYETCGVNMEKDNESWIKKVDFNKIYEEQKRQELYNYAEKAIAHLTDKKDITKPEITVKDILTDLKISVTEACFRCSLLNDKENCNMNTCMVKSCEIYQIRQKYNLGLLKN